MVKIGKWIERLHDNALTFSRIYQRMANYYDLYNFVSSRIIFTYDSYRERYGDKNIKILSGDRRIEYHWVNKNILTSRQELTLDNLDMQVEIKRVTRLNRIYHVITRSCLGSWTS